MNGPRPVTLDRAECEALVELFSFGPLGQEGNATLDFLHSRLTVYLEDLEREPQ